MSFFTLKKSLLLSAAAAMVSLLAACGSTGTATPDKSQGAAPAPEAAGTKIVVDGADGKLELKGVPKKIVTMEFSFTDTLVSLDVKPVGVADDKDPNLFMDAVKSKLGTYTSVGSRYEPNLEIISSLQPDLIIADLNKHKPVMDKLKAIAPTLVLDDYQADYAHMLSNVATIGKAIGKEAEAKKKIDEHKAKVEAAKKKFKNPNMTVLPAVVNPKGFFAHSDHSYSGSLLKELGFKDPVVNNTPYPELTLEQLVETNPQAMFLMPTEAQTIDKQWQTNPLWQKIAAVQNKKVVYVERRDWSLARGLIGADKMIDDLVKSLGE
jgi:ABC-type Fe3+-citrate transport system substrate-binding protein